MGSVYATLDDLAQLQLPPETIARLPQASVQACLALASSEMDSVFAGRYEMPLVTWDQSVTGCCVKIAGWHVLKRLGFNPERAGDAVIRKEYEDALSWLKGVSLRTNHPTVGESATSELLPNITTALKRGW